LALVAALLVIADRAQVLRKLKRFDEAERTYRTVIGSFERTLGAESSQVLRTRESLAGMLREAGRRDEAEACYRTNLEVLERTVGSGHGDALRISKRLGDLLMERGAYEEALPLLEVALEGQRKVLPEKDITVGVASASYGRCLLALRRYGEAETALLAAHEVALAVRGEAHAETQALGRDLAALYDAWGKPEQGARWRAAPRTP